jgi:fructose-1,6-bisphosphatase/inositol monophosphatase family enzyme
MNDFSPEIKFAADIARQSGQVMRDYFDGNQQSEIKSDGSPVTVADRLINRMVIESLEQTFPNDGLIGEEESTADYGPGRRWICDPIDGTIGYTWGVPTSMFSLGLVVDGEPQVGVAYDPYLDKMYTAISGNGAYCNDQRLRVSDKTLGEGVVAVTSNLKRISQGIDHVQALVDSSTYLATLSGAVYKAALIARGRFVGYVEEGVRPHDMAASQLIVEEAGGKVTDLEGNRYDYASPFQGTVVSNGVVHDDLLALLDRA